MKEMSNLTKKIPSIGMRTIKSAIGVFLGFVIYFIRGNQGMPFYTALSVLWCIRPYIKDTKEMAIQRTIGTFIGGIYGFILILFEINTTFLYNEFIRCLVISLSILPIIYTTILINKKNASYFSCVVFLSIVVMHITDENPYFFVFNRVLDTLIGIGIGIFLNCARIPRKKQSDILFVSGMDDTLLSVQETITPYSVVLLNRMLDDGAKFTIATMRTPASLIENLQGIRIQLPVIAMDGAVLFDMKEKRYLKKYEISYEETMEILNFISKRNFHVFINATVEDSWVIYYGNFKNEVEDKIYNSMRKSPYRNYVKKDIPEGQNILYLMIIDNNDIIENLYSDLYSNGWTKSYKILKYNSKDYPGYTYIKIYNKDSDKENMISYLKKLVNAREVITFGSIEGKYDVVTKDNDSNKVVKSLEKLYEPYFWKKN